MSKREAEIIRAEAESRNISCTVEHNDVIYWVWIGGRRWLSYFYGIMGLWDMIYKKEGVVL